MDNKAANKYLAKHAEKEALTAAELLNGSGISFRHCLCIPAFDEPREMLDRFIDFVETNEGTLLVLVINQPETQESETLNRDLAEGVALSGETVFSSDPMRLVSCKNNSAILLVDRFTVGRRIADKQGVGLARKIAADIALSLFRAGVLDNQWIHCTDADAVLPDNYFTATGGIDTATHAACLYPFQHLAQAGEAEKNLQQAHKLYEQRLNQYVNGLKYAGSPYAFHTIGSTLAINLDYYAKVRGFPKRNGGEDFYLLNKLRKTGEIKTLDQPQLILQSRLSQRAPFGTGVAVANLVASDDMAGETILYDRQVFELLKVTLAWCNQLHNQVIEKTAGWREHLDAYLRENTSAVQYREELISALTSLDFDQGIAHCMEYGTAKQPFDYHMMCWFDAFKTLKFIHHLRDHYFPALSARELSARELSVREL